MPRTIATISFALVFLAAFAALAGARADQLYYRPTPAFCGEATPQVAAGLQGPGGMWSGDGIIGGDGTTGPTFPPGCKDMAMMSAIDGELLPHWWAR